MMKAMGLTPRRHRIAPLLGLLLGGLALVPGLRAQPGEDPAPGPPPPPPAPHPSVSFTMTRFQGRAVPALSDRYLNDFGGLIDPITRMKILDLLGYLEEQTEQRLTVVTYPPLEAFGWPDSPATREDFLRVLYGAWGIAGDLPERPGHLLCIGRSPRHVLYLAGEGFRHGWTREIRDLLLDELPNPLEQGNFSDELLRLLEGAVYIVEENSGLDWITILATCGLAGFAFGAYGFILKLRAQDPPPPPPKQLAAERRYGEPEREITADDLFESLHPGDKG